METDRDDLEQLLSFAWAVTIFGRAINEPVPDWKNCTAAREETEKISNLWWRQQVMGIKMERQ